MATVIRPELSKKNKYYVEKHRYYELKHFCLQYPLWKKRYSEMDFISSSTYDDIPVRSSSPSNPTAKLAEKRLSYHDRIKLIEQVTMEADPELASYILKAVTEELSYTQLKTILQIPCGKDTYYDRYRRFFWLLDKSRD